MESAVGEFLHIFPDDVEPRAQPALLTASGPLRMTLAGNTWLRFSRTQLLASLVDILMVAAITGAIVWWMPIGVGTGAAIVTVIYYSLSTACLACSPGTWWLRTRGNRKRARGLRLAR